MVTVTHYEAESEDTHFLKMIEKHKKLIKEKLK